MSHRLSLPFPLLQSTDDDEDTPSDSSHSTPRSSFYLDPFDPRYVDDLRRRPHSLASLDSGYFSTMGKESSPCKSLRMPSRPDLRAPLLPINNIADATQVSPKRDGVIKNLLRKRKKSTASPDRDPFAAGLSRSGPVDDPVPQVPHPPSRSKVRDPSVEAFEVKKYFTERRRMSHHPYSRDDAPYMLAYEKTLLDNDKFSEILLRRLSYNHSPSFHDFTHSTPKTILDLGCGAGGWAVEAAEFWPASQVIGFDLVDPARLRGGAESPSNLQWKLGNFVKYKLPFPKNMFDLVRLANLSLSIPFDRWEHVLSEARRVLAQGGHLELIDDYLNFPYTKRLPQPSPDSHGNARVRPSSSSFDDVDDEEIKEDTDPIQLDGNDADNDDDDDDDDDDFVSTKSRFSTLVDQDDIPPVTPEPVYDPVAEWNRNIENSKSLEALFEDMLSRKFSVHPRPSKFLDSILDKVFGRYNQRRLHDFNLYLAPPQSHDSDDSSLGSSETHGSGSLRKVGFAKWVADHQKDKDKKHRMKGDRSSGEYVSNLSSVPDTVNAKAADRLGIQPTPQSTLPHAAQSPGLIVWPATFIQIPPFELEMHACKHMHSLLGSKAALMEYLLQDIARERQQPFDEQMTEDLIWDYETFRRKRFNWPSEYPDLHFEEDAAITTPRSQTFRNSVEAPHQASSRIACGSMGSPADPLFPREKLDFIRSIRVYSATKLDEENHVS